MTTLYVYDHCPFSMRPRLIAGLKKLDIKTHILPFSDKKTPISFIGKKICPFLVLDSGKTKTESTELAAYLDTLSQPEILTSSSISQDCQNLISFYLKTIVALTAPQFINIPYPEFKTTEDIAPFKLREESFIGHSLNETKLNFTMYQKKVTQFFNEANQFLSSSIGTKEPIKLSMNDVALFAFFRNLSCVPDLEIPTKIQNFTTILAKKASINVYKKTY